MYDDVWWCMMMMRRRRMNRRMMTTCWWYANADADDMIQWACGYLLVRPKTPTDLYYFADFQKFMSIRIFWISFRLLTCGMCSSDWNPRLFVSLVCEERECVCAYKKKKKKKKQSHWTIIWPWQSVYCRWGCSCDWIGRFPNGQPSSSSTLNFFFVTFNFLFVFLDGHVL